MKTKGIRIADSENGVVSVDLLNILEEIPNGDGLHWSMLFLWAMGDLGEDVSILDLEKKASDLPRGLFIHWEELNALASKFNQIIDLVLIGCNNRDILHRYEKDQDMYEACDIVIVMFDSSFWEVFSKDDNFIQRLASKFKKIELLRSDFENYFNLGDSANRRHAMQRPRLTHIEDWKSSSDEKTGSLYDYIPYTLKETGSELCFAFCELFWPTFVVHQSHVFLSESFSEERFNQLSKENENIEYRMNFIAIDPYFMYEENRFNRAEFVGRTLTEAWREKLKHDFPKLQFKVEYRWDMETKNYGVSFYQAKDKDLQNPSIIPPRDCLAS